MTDYGPDVDQYADWIERPTGILTKKDRQWLYETKEDNDMYETEQGRRKRRSDAATRLRNGIIDFSVLMRVHPEQREELIERIGFGSQVDSAVREGVKDCIAWLFECIQYSPNIEFEDVLKDGVNKAYIENNTVEDKQGRLNYRYVDSVDINWDTHHDPRALRQAFLQGEELDDADLGALVRMQVGTDRIRDQLQETDGPQWPPTPDEED